MASRPLYLCGFRVGESVKFCATDPVERLLRGFFSSRMGESVQNPSKSACPQKHKERFPAKIICGFFRGYSYYSTYSNTFPLPYRISLLKRFGVCAASVRKGTPEPRGSLLSVRGTGTPGRPAEAVSGSLSHGLGQIYQPL